MGKLMGAKVSSIEAPAGLKARLFESAGAAGSVALLDRPVHPRHLRRRPRHIFAPEHNRRQAASKPPAFEAHFRERHKMGEIQAS